MWSHRCMKKASSELWPVARSFNMINEFGDYSIVFLRFSVVYPSSKCSVLHNKLPWNTTRQNTKKSRSNFQTYFLCIAITHADNVKLCLKVVLSLNNLLLLFDVAIKLSKSLTVLCKILFVTFKHLLLETIKRVIKHEVYLEQIALLCTAFTSEPQHTKYPKLLLKWVGTFF